MGNCIYCQKPVGWFRSKHPECEQNYRAEMAQADARLQDGENKVMARAHAALNGTESMAELPSVIASLQKDYGLSDSDIRNLLVHEWERAVEAFLDDGLLIDEEERRLVEFARASGFELAALPQFERVVKSAVLTDLVNGRTPRRFNIPDDLPVNLQRGETAIWACANTAYLEDKTRRQYVGGSQGISVRIMSGVYYRVGAFKGHAIEKTERVHIDDGWLVITDKNIYFVGPRKSLRIAYPKIVSLEPFSDGIGLHRDAATAKPQIFVTGDGWFTYNLVTNLAKQ